jgi:hypothetical protein
MSWDHKSAVGTEKIQDFAEKPFAVAEASNLDFAHSSLDFAF